MMQRIAVLFMTLVLVGCANQNAGPHGASGDWGFIKFAEVRAFQMNWANRYARSQILDGGKMNRTRMPKDGIALNENQVRCLRVAVTGSHPLRPFRECLHPHHAFVFYDESRKIVGTLDVCFLCGNHEAWPKGFDENADMAALELLVKDLGMPIKNPKWDY
jgi:hypothetical protein